MKKHKNGFTLAEVLITLVIIGIIAAMTIPTLMNKTNEQELVVATKKAYSILNQAHQRMVAEYGEMSYSAIEGSNIIEKRENFGNMFSKQLNVQKNCGISTGGDCFSTSGYAKFSAGKIDSGTKVDINEIASYKLVLSDGMMLNIGLLDVNDVPEDNIAPLDKVYGFVSVDVNGAKGPNVYNYDYQEFWITSYGIVPEGLANDAHYPFSGCPETWGCSSWVIAKGNMDYLRKDVSW